MPIGERQPRPEKIEMVSELKEMLNSETLILTSYTGLDVKSIAELRKKLRESGIGYKVVKNTLLIRAAADTPALPLVEGLVGQTAVAYTDADPVTAAKTLQEFTKGARPIVIKSGLVDGQIYDAAQIEALSKVPAKEVLYSMLVGGLQGPITGVVSTLKNMISQLVFTLKAVEEKKAAA